MIKVICSASECEFNDNGSCIFNGNIKFTMYLGESEPTENCNQFREGGE
jgi:hypothetical protein